MEWRRCPWHSILGQTWAVSKSGETGEYVGKGIRYSRSKTWYKDIDLRLGIGLVAINGIPLLMASADKAQKFVLVTSSLHLVE